MTRVRKAVIPAAGLKVGGGLVDHGGRNGRGGRQLGVGVAGAADDEKVLAACAGGVRQAAETWHALQPAQQTGHDDTLSRTGAGQGRRQVFLGGDLAQAQGPDRGEAGRELRHGGTLHQQVGVGVGKEQDAT